MANEHDKLFKKIETNKENALDLIQGILPDNIKSKLDFKNFELSNNSFINENLKEYYSDLIYDCDYKDRNVKITILLEHKSYKPENEYFQILKYITNIWDFEIKHKLKPSIIIPIIFYHGKKGWEKKVFYEYFKNIDEDFYQFIPKFDYILTDLSKIDDQKIKKELFKRNINIALLLLFKYIFRIELQDKLDEILETIKDEIEKTNEENNYFISILNYILSTSEIDFEIIKEKVSKISEIGGNILMTTAMKLKEEGIKEGIKEGMKEGIKEGILTAKRNTLITLLNKKFRLTKEECLVIENCNDTFLLDEAIDKILFCDNKNEILEILKK